MRLVLDTNVMFSFFRENPVRSIILNAAALGLELYAPEYSFEELWENSKSLLKYSGLKDEKELLSMMTNLKSFVDTRSMNSFSDFKSEASRISPHEKDSP